MDMNGHFFPSGHHAQAQPNLGFPDQLFEDPFAPRLQPHPQPELHHQLDPQQIGFDPHYHYTGTVLPTPQGSEYSASPTQNAANALPSSDNGQVPVGQAMPTSDQTMGAQDIDMFTGDDMGFQREKSNSSGEGDEKDDSAQSKRKAQNRAAQRAFRERKELRVRNLEQELAEHKQNLNSIMKTNELLQREIMKINTENEILKATSMHRQVPQHSPSPSPSHLSSSHPHHDDGNTNPTQTGPIGYQPKPYDASNPAHRIILDPDTGDKLLSANAAWDMIVETLESKGLQLDVQRIYQKLKMVTKCNGQGPAVAETKVRQAIEESVLEGESDELI
ncbi:hypothetical protein KEM55_000393 [Ascosphaera atra]|nr:hypothetical protein KEM55_000393 [Ascosphaera atra]